MRRLTLETPLYEALGAKAPYLRRLEYLGIKTVGDLLAHFPTRYEDYSKIYSIDQLEPGQTATIQAAVEDVRIRHTRRGLAIVEAIIADEAGTIRAIWFNQAYIAHTLRPGRVANFSGKISISEENELYLNNPTYEILRSTGTKTTNHTARLVPIYPETRGLTSRGIRFVMNNILRRVQSLKEWIPEQARGTANLPEINNATKAVHFPLTLEHATAARRRFDFENLFLLQLFNLEQKRRLAEETANAIRTDIEMIKSILASLSFELTPSQKKSLWEIIQDIEKPRPMNRLLQGDVGSGKTIVAMIASVVAAVNGHQSAFMAPTEILARQHFETACNFLERIPEVAKPVLGFLSGGEAIVYFEAGVTTALSKEGFRKKVKNGEISIVFGTHALIQKSISFKNIGLVVIDEQHRFGVRQRQTLSRGNAQVSPHFLSMSATPIPRTLMLTLFGNLNLSLITELPAGRKPIETKIVSPLERQMTYEFIRKEIQNGRQAFVICPRIEKNEAADPLKDSDRRKLEVKSVIEEYERLSKKIFPELRVGMLHGQMKPRQKDDIMRRFKDCELDILISTSVIEVGVDVPNATIMMIEGADRFGLAQLYQFRGRVGRGEHASYCFLLTDSSSETTAARLKAVKTARNGFELAEEDLKLRGPGQFFGEVQTGFPDAAMSALQDAELVKASRDAATAVMADDPSLVSYSALKQRFDAFKKTIHRE